MPFSSECLQRSSDITSDIHIETEVTEKLLKRDIELSRLKV